MRILVLRPQPDATRTSAAMAQAGHEPVVAPLFTVVPTGDACPDGPFDAVVITSANAVAPIIAGGPAHSADMPLFAVGARSAAVAHEAGFKQVESADGARSDLIALLKARLKPGARLLLALGRDHKDDLPPQLEDAGLRPVLWRAYDAVPVSELPEAARSALKADKIDAILHYSRRGAETFIALTSKAGHWNHAASLPHVVLSADVAHPLRAHGAPHIVIAPRPDENALLQSLSGISARNWPVSGDTLDTQSDQAPAPQPGPATGDGMSAGGNDRENDPARQSSAQTGRSGRGRRQPAVIEGDIIRESVTESTPEQATATDAAPQEIPPAGSKATEAASSAQPLASPATSAAPSPSASRFGVVAIIGAGVLGGLFGTAATLALSRLIPALDGSSGRTEDLGRQLAQMQETTAPRQALEALNTRLTTAGAAAERAQAESAATAKRLADLLAAAPAGADVASIAPIAERAKRAEALAVSATESLASREKLLDEAARKVGDLAARLAAIEQTAKVAAAPSSAAMNATRLVLTNRIVQALEGGKPFASDLKALVAAGPGGPDAARLAPLVAVAEQGAASRDALHGEFRRLRAALEQDTASQSASLGDRFLKVMEGVVSVRPLGEQAGTSPLALTSRIDRALANGDMTAAATAWKLLPEPARRASESFGARLAARASASVAIRQIEDETVAALGASR